MDTKCGKDECKRSRIFLKVTKLPKLFDLSARPETSSMTIGSSDFFHSPNTTFSSLLFVFSLSI